MTPIIYVNPIKSAYASSKAFIQDHKYQLAAGAAAISAIAVAALALYSGRFSLPQSANGKKLFVLATSLIGWGAGTGAGGVYLAEKGAPHAHQKDYTTRGTLGGLVGGAIGASAGAVVGVSILLGASILLNR